VEKMKKINGTYTRNKKENKLVNKQSKFNVPLAKISKLVLAVALFIFLSLIVNAGDVVVDSGKVGIGTTNPSQKLEVLGMVYANGGGLIASSNYGMQWNMDGTKKIAFDSLGNIGMTPTEKLDVAGDLQITGDGTGLDMNATANANIDDIFHMAVGTGGTAAQDYIQFGNGAHPGNQHMVIRGDGNVGIGTTTPGIHGFSGAAINGHVTHMKSSAGEGYFIVQNNQPGIFLLDTDGPHNERWNSLVLENNKLILSARTDGNAPRQQLIAFDNSNGNVGIGTTSPTSKLHVIGKATITGGIDPPYISFSNETYESIRDYAKDVEEHEKAMLFWNDKTHRIEVYDINEDKFYTITGEQIA
jgi:hypothetical protein